MLAACIILNPSLWQTNWVYSTKRDITVTLDSGGIFHGIVAMIVAGMASERWYTRSMFIGSMWLLYLYSSWYESGMWEAEQLEGTWGALIWLGFTFFLCVGIYMISTHEKYGGWSNLDDHEISGARKFWNEHWSSLMVGAAFFSHWLSEFNGISYRQ